ncbi:E3 ubiquitin-protein ligase rnf213-beta [Silurus meridionalis]|nr:E3 ubiquitin-protein ligase rnf213-beta [Silurus meridionalis]
MQLDFLSLKRDRYLQNISQYFPQPLNSKQALEHEISSCQDFFLQSIRTKKTIAKNLALKENVFLMVVCIELKIPLFLVGKPGSSKSLAKTVVADVMQGQASYSELFQKLKEVHMMSFQCSPHSSPEGIIGTFRNCARFQKEKNLDEFVSVVVLDEIGLAEDSPQMPLKTLHPLLEDGCIDNDQPDPHMKVGFVGISNWALDPAKMNRGIFVSRWDPSENELVETAKGICSSSESVLHKIIHLLPKLAKGFLNICKNDRDQFFGLRDYYNLVKMIFAVVKNTDSEPNESDLANAILRNFSGQKDNFDPLCYFQDLFSNEHEVPTISTLEMIKQNLNHNSEEECRYLLLLTTNNAALYIIQQCIFTKDECKCPEIVFGSGFPKDQEYAQICRNVSRVKTCMETGRTVILLNLLNLYESLYDALNQYYAYFCGQQYVDLGLGSHRVKCRVHKEFRLVVIEDQEKVYDKFPVPLKNRLEKHRVDRSTDLTPAQQRVLEKLKNWVNEFSQHSDFGSSDDFVGFHGDACASALLQASESREKLDHQIAGDGQVDTNIPRKRHDSVPVSTEFASTGDGTNEHNEQVYDPGSGVAINDDHENALTDTDTGNTPLNENSEGLVLMDVDENEDGVEPENEQDAIADIPGPMEMDIYPQEVRLNDPKQFKDEEDEVYECAKNFLLNCATPDSVLRLKYSGLGNNEVERLQKLYFQQQDHHSLKSFMDNYLRKTDKEKKRFVELTTFSSLLTKADVRNLAQDLGLSMESFLLLSLHQFDTEASFCSKIRDFLKAAHLSLHVLLIQMDMEESLCKNELIASAKYCTMNELLALRSDDHNCYIVFITKLSRIASDNKYIGFQGVSMDVDQEKATVKSQLDKSAYLHSLSLVRSCTQKAVSLLRDSVNNDSRSVKRMHTLLGLLDINTGRIGARFQEVLQRRLVVALTQREECMPNAGDWVNKEIKKREALQEGGTLRHTLWRCLQGVLTPILAWILEVLDRDSNLELVYNAGLSEGLVQFWLDIFDDGQILDLPVPQNSSSSEQEIDMQYNLLVGGEARTCTAPFSWLIRLYCYNLWEESRFLQSIEQNSHERIQQFVSSVTSSRLGGYIETLSERERIDLGQRYLTDYVILSFKIKTEEEVKVFRAAILGCVAALQQDIGVNTNLSPAWIMAAAQHFSPRLDTLVHILQIQPQLAPFVLKQSLKTDRPDMDTLLCVGWGETLEAKELQRRQPDDINFLNRLARKQTPSREQQPAEFLLSMAHLRMCLDTAARILPRAVRHKSGGCLEWEERMLEEIKAIFNYAQNDWYRVYLLRTLNRQAGTDCVQAVMNSTAYEWIFPPEILRLQRLIPVEVDRFLCCGEQYRTIRDGVGQVLLESNSEALKATLQNVSCSVSMKCVLLVLALFRQDLAMLNDIVRESTKGHLRDFCTSLLGGGLMPHLHVCANESAERRLLLELLVHAIAVFHSGSRLLFPFHLIASRPEMMREAFLPTMPEDNTSKVTQWLKEPNLKKYYCAKGHPAFVGECGKPVVEAKCDTCGVPIGGLNHRAVPGFTLVHGNVGDQTRPGHILDNAVRRSEAPNRDLSMPQSCVLRLFLHLAMLHGSYLNQQGISAIIHPTVDNAREFLWHHLEKDIEVLGKTLNLNCDDTAITVHLILNTSADLPTGL